MNSEENVNYDIATDDPSDEDEEHSSGESYNSDGNSIIDNEREICVLCKETFGDEDGQVTYSADHNHVFHANRLSDGCLCPAYERDLCRRVKDDFKSIVASTKTCLEECEPRIDSILEFEGLDQRMSQQLQFLKLKMTELKLTVETQGSKVDLCAVCKDTSPNSCEQVKHLKSKRTELQSHIAELTSVFVQLTSIIGALGSVEAA